MGDEFGLSVGLVGAEGSLLLAAKIANHFPFLAHKGMLISPTFRGGGGYNPTGMADREASLSHFEKSTLRENERMATEVAC